MSKEIVSLMKSGFTHYTLRTIFVNGLKIISALALSYLLIPEDYATFGILNSWIGSLLFFTDVGLKETIVQVKDRPTEKHYRSYLAMRLILGFTISLIFFFIAPMIIDYFKIQTDYQLLISYLGVYAFFETLRCIPFASLQRSLNYKKLAEIEIYSTVTLYIVQLTFAFFGYGFWSLFIGMFARLFVEIILLHKVDKKVLLPKLNFKIFKGQYVKSIYFQLTAILFTLRGLFIPFILSWKLDLQEIGLVFWIQGVVGMPFFLVLNFQQITFPGLSSLKSDMQELIKVTNAGLKMMEVIIFLIFTLGALIGPFIIIKIFPERWYPAIEIIPIAALSWYLWSVKFLYNPIISAIGRSQKKLKAEIISLFLEVIICLFFMNLYGIKGFFYGQILSFFTVTLILQFYLKDIVELNFLKRVLFSVILFSIGIFLHYRVSESISIFQNLWIYFICIVLPVASFQENRKFLINFKNNIIKRN